MLLLKPIAFLAFCSWSGLRSDPPRLQASLRGHDNLQHGRFYDSVGFWRGELWSKEGKFRRMHKGSDLIYVLHLEDNNHYVGLTSKGRFTVRMEEHASKNMKGALQTDAFKPIRVHQVLPVPQSVDSHLYEDFVTMVAMGKYGLNNVRGGSWCLPNVFDDDAEREVLEEKVRYLTCFRDERLRHSLPKATALWDESDFIHNVLDVAKEYRLYIRNWPNTAG
eukprot:scaffold1703_cov252-Pinguiococcus_pyrenoidosus.AAC.3